MSDTCKAVLHHGFNPSVGILVVRTHPAIPRGAPGIRFNPSVGILVVRTGVDLVAGNDGRGFNPSVGILVVRTIRPHLIQRQYHMFQSLGRDSGCSDGAPGTAVGRPNNVSIPRSGFWLFGPEIEARIIEHLLVSIPRSGFWLFGPLKRDWARRCV